MQLEGCKQVWSRALGLEEVCTDSAGSMLGMLFYTQLWPDHTALEQNIQALQVSCLFLVAETKVWACELLPRTT